MKKFLSVAVLIALLASCGGGYNPPNQPGVSTKPGIGTETNTGTSGGQKKSPAAMFSYKTQHPFKVFFTNNSTNATTYHWDFGDGYTSTDENPAHAYPKKGVYKVTLTAKNSGKQNTISKTITITEPTKCNVIGFEIVNIPTQNEYYRIRFSDADLIFVSSDWTTSWVLLSSANIPYEIPLKAPQKIDFTEDEYYLRLYTNSKATGDGSVVDRWSIYTQDLKKYYNESVVCSGNNSFVILKLNWTD